jgi:hypothetical protein
MNVIERPNTAHTENSLGNRIRVSCCKQNPSCVHNMTKKTMKSGLVSCLSICYPVFSRFIRFPDWL